VPEGFALGALATRETWEYAIHAPERCTVRLEAPVSFEARASFGPRAVIRDQDSGAVVELTVTNGEALARHVLALGERAQIVAPPRWREKARAILDDLAGRCA